MAVLLNSNFCKIVLLSLFLLNGVSFVFAQNTTTSIKDNKQNTLEELVHNIQTDTAVANTQEYAEAILNYPILDKNTIDQWVIVAIFFYQKGQLDRSLRFLNKAIELANQLQINEVLSRAYSIKGHIYLRKTDDQKALDAYYKAIAIAKQQNNVEHEILAKSGMIIVYQRTKRWEKGQELVSYMLKNIDKTSYVNKENNARIYTTINDFFLAQEAYDTVLHFSNKGIALSEKLDFKEGLVDHNIKKGIVYYHKGKYNEAFEFLKKAQQLIETNDVGVNSYDIFNTNYFIASCYYKLKDYNEAIRYAVDNIQVSGEEDLDKMVVIQTHLLLANCYREKRDYETALHWNEQYVKLKARHDEKKGKTLDIIYDTSANELETEIAELKQEIQAEKTNKNIYSFVSIFISIILVLLAIQYFRRQRSNRKKFNDLMNQITVLEAQENLTKENMPDAKEVSIDDEKVAKILKKLNELEEKEYFLRPDCNLNTIAKKIKTNTTYLSKIIHTYKNKSVKDYFNDLRIEYVLKRIKDDRKFRSFSIKSIANEIGYKSDNSFTKHFKSKTGINPSYYIKNIEKLEEQLQRQNT